MTTFIAFIIPWGVIGGGIFMGNHVAEDTLRPNWNKKQFFFISILCGPVALIYYILWLIW